MYLLSIVFGPTPTAWALLFKTEEKAADAYDKAGSDLDTTVSITDDFGQTCKLKTYGIHAVMLEDLEKSKVAAIERGLHQARIQARAQQMAQSDPLLKSIAMTRGPSMIDPMGAHRFNG